MRITAARILLERGFRVAVYAREFATDTTSGVAGGQWFPFTFYDPEKLTPAVEDQFVQAARYAYNRYQTLVGPYYGIRWLTNYQMSDKPLPANGLMSRTGPMASMMPEYADLPRGSHPFPFRYARQFDTMFIEPPVYLETMMREVRLAGAAIENREFHDTAEMLALPQKLIVNCTGLGAKSLFQDEELMPIRGSSRFCCRRAKWNTPRCRRSSICFLAAMESCSAALMSAAYGIQRPMKTRWRVSSRDIARFSISSLRKGTPSRHRGCGARRQFRFLMPDFRRHG